MSELDLYRSASEPSSWRHGVSRFVASRSRHKDALGAGSAVEGESRAEGDLLVDELLRHGSHPRDHVAHPRPVLDRRELAGPADEDPAELRRALKTGCQADGPEPAAL